jgi:hypothetical protein
MLKEAEASSVLPLGAESADLAGWDQGASHAEVRYLYCGYAHLSFNIATYNRVWLSLLL